MLFNRFRIFIAYLFAIPLALILGFLSASPDELTYMLIALLLFCLALPLFIKWHHALLILFWNSAFFALFLPGQPGFWLFFAALSFGLSFLNRLMGQKPFVPVPEMTKPLLFLAVVAIGTAFYRGGIGFRALGGSANGGKQYTFILGAIVGYYAFTAGRVAIAKGERMTALFFLSGASASLPNLAFTLGPAFYFLFYFVPSGTAMDQAASVLGSTPIDRISGLGNTGSAIVCFLLTVYGIKGLFNLAKPWRLLFLLAAIGTTCFAGFRSALAILLLVLAFQFYFEGLFRTRLFPVLIGLGTVALVVVLIFAGSMPLSVQRTLSFLPASLVRLDSLVRVDAEGSSQWRFDMWAVVVKDVPNYLLIGKGYGINAGELDAVSDGVKKGILAPYEEAMLAQDYHSGPLSLIVPLGIWGLAAFLWVLYAGFRVLYSNYRYSDPQLRRANTVLLSSYLANCLAYFFIFGAFSAELYLFLGTIGLSVCLNGGMRRKTIEIPAHMRDSLRPIYVLESGIRV